MRKIATETSPLSRVKVLDIYSRRSMPVGLKLNPNTYVLTGVKSDMQYRGEGQNWRKTTGMTSLNLVGYAKEDQESMVEVRMAATKTASASLPQQFVLQKLSPQIQGLRINYPEETIVGFDPKEKYLYKKSNVASWSSAKLTDGKLNISDISSMLEPITLQLKKMASDHAPESVVTNIVLPQVLTPPTDAKFVYNVSGNLNKAMLVNVTGDMEYRKAGQAWIGGDSHGVEIDLPSGNTQYSVRVKATDTSFPSRVQILTMLGKRGQPSVVYNSTTEVISGFKDTMEYSINNAEYVKAGSQPTLDVSSLIDSIEEGGTATLTVRSMPTETYPVSQERAYTFYPRKSMPTGLIFDKETSKLSGVNSSMQYREEGTNEWKAISSTVLTLKTLINGRTNVVLEVRYKPASNAAASKAVSINLY